MLASNNTWSFSGAVNQQTGRRCAELRRVLAGERATTGLHCVYRHLEHTQAERSASLCKGRVQTPQRGFFCCAYPACRCFCTSATAPPPVAAAPLASVGVSQPSCSLSAAACSTSSPSLPPTCSAVVVFAPPFGGISGRTNSGASQDMLLLLWAKAKISWSCFRWVRLFQDRTLAPVGSSRIRLFYGVAGPNCPDAVATAKHAPKPRVSQSFELGLCALRTGEGFRREMVVTKSCASAHDPTQPLDLGVARRCFRGP